MTVDEIAQYITIASAISGGIYWAVLKPLRMEIERLERTITEINETIEAWREDNRELDKRLTRVEQSDKSAHKRIDQLEELVIRGREHG